MYCCLRIFRDWVWRYRENWTISSWVKIQDNFFVLWLYSVLILYNCISDAIWIDYKIVETKWNQNFQKLQVHAIVCYIRINNVYAKNIQNRRVTIKTRSTLMMFLKERLYIHTHTHVHTTFALSDIISRRVEWEAIPLSLRNFLPPHLATFSILNFQPAAGNSINSIDDLLFFRLNELVVLVVVPFCSKLYIYIRELETVEEERLHHRRGGAWQSRDRSTGISILFPFTIKRKLLLHQLASTKINVPRCSLSLSLPNFTSPAREQLFPRIVKSLSSIYYIYIDEAFEIIRIYLGNN